MAPDANRARLAVYRLLRLRKIAHLLQLMQCVLLLVCCAEHDTCYEGSQLRRQALQVWAHSPSADCITGLGATSYPKT